MNKQDALFDAITAAHTDAEDVTERLFPERQQRIVEILMDPFARDPEIWVEMFDDEPFISSDWIDDPMEDLNDVPEDERGTEWRLTVEMFLAAATKQADAEIILRPLWAANQASTVNLIDAENAMDEPELKAASHGPGKQRFKDAKNKRKQA